MRQIALFEDGELEEDRYTKLVSIGIDCSSLSDIESNATIDQFFTNASKQKTWEQHYEELKTYHSTNGHAQVTKVS
jgi:hypothetical protein